MGWNGSEWVEWVVERILIRLRSGEERIPPLLCLLVNSSPTASWLGNPQL